MTTDTALIYSRSLSSNPTRPHVASNRAVTTRGITWRRNWSSRASELSGGDAIVISIPKSGRTWLRTFLCAYFCHAEEREFSLEPERYRERGIPRIVYSHDLFEQRTKGGLWDKIRGKYLVPAGQLRRAKILLLARDPRDAFVSLHVQLTRRTRETSLQLKRKTAGELLRDRAHGLRSIVAVMNSWLREFSSSQNFQIVRYEALRSEPAEHFRMVLTEFLKTEIDRAAFEHALAFSEFENMKKMEAAGAFRSKILQPGNVADPESFKVRNGRVGSHREYLSDEDIVYAAREMRRLDPRFGY